MGELIDLEEWRKAKEEEDLYRKRPWAWKATGEAIADFERGSVVALDADLLRRVRDQLMKHTD